MHMGILQNFIDCIEGKSTLLVEGQEGIKSLLLSNAMYLSSWQKKMIMLPQTKGEQALFEEKFAREFQEKHMTQSAFEQIYEK